MNENIVIVSVGTGAGEITRGISGSIASSWLRLIHVDVAPCASSPHEHVINIGLVDDTDSAGIDATIAELWESLEGTRLVIIVACLGHRTGSECVQAIARKIEQEEISVFYFVTLPFDIEGNVQRETANIALNRLRKIAETVISVDNNLLFRYFPENTKLGDAFELANTALADGIIGVAEVIRCRDMIPIDFSRMKAALNHKGSSCSFGIGKASGDNQCDDVIEALFQSPTLGDVDSINSADVIIATLVGGPDLSVKDINECIGALQARLSSSTETIIGAHTVPDREHGIQLTLVVVHYPEEKKSVDETLIETVHIGSINDIFGFNGKHADASQKQPSLPFDEGMSVGIFSEAVATMYNDQNLDIPTFLRLGVELQLEDDVD